MDSTLQTSTVSSISEQKYINLRKRLDQLGYRQTLGIESLPLIEKLFNDLVHTTESLKKTKLELSKNVDQLNNSMRNMSVASSSNLNGGELSAPSIQAYKSDNAKLVKENNDLHMEVIKIREEFEQQIKDIKTKMSRVEHENSDLRFLNTQYLHKLRAVEKESKDKTKKILELQEKNFQAVIQIPNGNKHQFSFRRQRLDIDCMLPTSTSSTTSSSSSSGCSCSCSNLASTASDPYVIDMIKLADDRIANLQDDLDKFKQCNEILEAKVSNYKTQVENRDREIERLTRCLDGGRSFDAVSLETKLRNNEKLIAHQNLQIEFLQEKNHELERRIHQLIDSKQDDMCEKIKNDDLVRDIKEMNRLARKAEIEKQMVVDQADRELEQAKYELTRSREEINSLDTVVQQLELEKQSITNEMLSLRNQLEQKQSEINGLHELVDRIQDDKTKLAKKISKYLENEKELVQELDAYKSGKRSSSNLNRSNSAKSLTNKLDAHIKNIESERDFYKQEVETLQKLLKSAQLDHKVSVSVVDCGNGATSTSYTTSEMSRQSRKEEKPTSRKSTTVKTTTTTSSGTRCSVCSCHVSKSPNRPNSGGKNNSAVVQNLNNIIAQHVDEIKQLKRERDELKCLLDKFERHMNDIQSNVKLVTNERDKVAQLYDEAKEELRAARCELVKCSSKTSNASLAAQAILKRIENERDSAIFDLKNTANERDSYRERLRMTNEAAIKDKACFEQQIDDLESRQRNLEYDKKELCKQIDMLQQQIEQLEHSLRSQNEQLAMTMQDLQDQKDTSTQIRMLAEESERALDEQRRQLSQKNDELHQMEQSKFRVEQKLGELQELCRAQKDEIAQLRFTANSLDKDKDKLLMSIDEKTVENVTFKQELASKHRRIDELNSQLAQLEAALDHSNDELKCKLKEITQLRIQCDRCNEENSELGRHYDSACRENKRLQEDFITMTRENQVLHCELDKANSDKERLRDQLQDYINEVQKFEELLKQKEHDRSNLLDQYKDLSNELGQMKMTLNALENEASNLRIETQMKGADNKRLRERLDAAERDFQHQLAACQEYEVKLSSANRNIQRLEEMVKMSQTESKEMGQEIMHMRELNANLEQSRDELARKLSNKEVEVEELQNAIADKRVEIDLLKSQLNTERTKVNQLEDMMAHNHERDLHMQLSTQERDSEIKLLKERIVISEQKLQSQNKEINVLRTKLVEYENEAERLKRQLTNERFERERANQELRKLTECDLTTATSTSKYGGRCTSPISRTVIFSGGASGGTTSTVMTTTTSCLNGNSNNSSGSCVPPVILPSSSSSSSSNSSSSCQYHHNQLCPHSSNLSTHGNNGGTSAAAAAVAAAAAAVANVTSSSNYKSHSPIRSKSPCKDLVSTTSFAHKSNSFSASSNLRY